MTRAQRIALAMYSPLWHQVRQEVADAPAPYLYASHGCYEAPDDVDEAPLRVRTYDWAPCVWDDGRPAVQILVGGNFGLPCA